jgi:hypothetical protein
MRHRLYGGGRAELTGEQLNPINAWKMVRRRAKAAGITTEVCNHTFRGTGIMASLENDGTLERRASGTPCLHPHHAALRPARGPRHARWGREDQYSGVGRGPTLRSTQQKYLEKPTQSLQRGSRQLCATANATIASVARAPCKNLSALHRLPLRRVARPNQLVGAGPLGFFGEIRENRALLYFLPAPGRLVEDGGLAGNTINQRAG